MADQRVRREATVREAKAMAHPLRLRILRLCLHQELTNKQLAERLGRDPGTVLYHVRHLTGIYEAVHLGDRDTHVGCGIFLIVTRSEPVEPTAGGLPSSGLSASTISMSVLRVRQLPR